MIEKEKLITMVRSVQNGDEGAATQLYETFRDSIYYQIYKTVDNDVELAEDLTQDTFIEILETIGQLQEPAAFVTWSKQIAYHKCTGYFKKRKEILLDENEDGYSAFDTVQEDREEFIPDEALDKEDLKQTIQNMINDLPEEQRSAILLRYFNEISVKEIAQIQGVTEGTVKSRLNYGRKAIKQAVETYEKKNDIKLHCAGVIPLLLWFFRAYRVSNGISITDTAASAYTITASAAEVTAATTTAAATTASSAAVETGVGIGVKAAGKAVATKAIAAATAATVAVGGVAYGIFAKPDIDTWQGYGDVFYQSYQDRRFEVTIDDMDNSYISGHLEVSHLYEIEHDTEFEGQGTEKDGRICYEIVFETPRQGELTRAEFSEASLEYDKKTQILYLDGVDELDGLYEAILNPVDGKEKIIYQNKIWTGQGENDFRSSRSEDVHRFELLIYEMRQSTIRGRLRVFYNGAMDHESEFTGRGFKEDGQIHYEIKLNNPRTQKSLVTLTMDNFWLHYSISNNTFEIPWPYHYQAVLYTSDHQLEETVTTPPTTIPETTEATEVTETTQATAPPASGNSSESEYDEEPSVSFEESVPAETEPPFVIIITPVGDVLEGDIEVPKETTGGNTSAETEPNTSDSASDSVTSDTEEESADSATDPVTPDHADGDDSADSSGSVSDSDSGSEESSGNSGNLESPPPMLDQGMGVVPGGTGTVTGSTDTSENNTPDDTLGDENTGSSSSGDDFVLIITPIGDPVENLEGMEIPEG